MQAPGTPTDTDAAGLYEHAACGLLLTDDDGLVLRANATFCGWLGCAPEALVGRRRFQDLLTVGGRIFHQTHWAPLLRMQGSVGEVKLEIQREGETPLPLVLNAIRREHGGRMLHELALIVVKDRHAYERELLAARKRAEELLAAHLESRQALELAETRLRMALEAGTQHVWELDPATMERSLDPGVALLLGHPSPGPVRFEEFLAAVEPADREPALQALQRMLQDPAQAYRHAYRLNGVDGVRRTVLSTGRAMRAPDGTVPRVIGVLQDITELTAQRAAAEDRALFAEQMVGIVSHDLRNPLATIRTATDVLKMIGVPERYESLFGNLERATGRALRLVSELLDFTRARLGRGLSVEPRPIDLHATVATQVAELALAHPEARIEHDIAGDGDCVADPDRLAQLVGNLVSNALAYGRRDAPVRVSTATSGARCIISVRNEGTPIPEALVATLFRPMVRGTDEGADVRSVGLGLYIVAEVARAHGGDVRLASSTDAGTEFVASFPRTPQPSGIPNP